MAKQANLKIESWVNPQADIKTRKKIESWLTSVRPPTFAGAAPRVRKTPQVSYGQVRERAPLFAASQLLNTPLLGVRSFAREHGVENLLKYDPKTKAVTLGGYNVPYALGYQGRTYASTSPLYDVLKKIKADQRATKTPSGTAALKRPVK